jgi:hypothetical protein
VKTLRVRVENILLPPNVPAGMDLSVLAHFSMICRKTGEDPDPIILKPTDTPGVYRIHDGRHRFLGAVVAGRHDVLAEVKS